MIPWEKNDLVWIDLEGRREAGRVILASDNHAALMLEFEAMLGGYVGRMAVLRDDAGVYRELIDQRPVQLSPRLSL